MLVNSVAIVFTYMIIKGNIPDPFPIPTFRNITEENLSKHVIPDGDRIYMVQTLATILMTYKTKPSLTDCLNVSKALHAKFRFMGGEESEVIHYNYIMAYFTVHTYSLFRIHGGGLYTHELKM